MTVSPVPLIIGHRGAPGYRPEHTRSSYLLAFELGAEAVEPDLVVSSDGVLVLRHENNIADTTDVSAHPEFADRFTTKIVDGREHTGWFAEDFTWAELQTLRGRERLPEVRPESASYNDTEPLLCFADLLELVDEASSLYGRRLGIVIEIKHASHFDRLGFPIDVLLRDALSGWPTEGRTWIESFELTVLDRLRAAGVTVPLIYLIEPSGVPGDQLHLGDAAQTYAQALTPRGLHGLRGRVDGISLNRRILLREGAPELVEAAHDLGLLVFTWTLRPENKFLGPANRIGTDPAAFGDWLGEFGQILYCNVDGIFLDHPDLGVAARAQYRNAKIAAAEPIVVPDTIPLAMTASITLPDPVPVREPELATASMPII